MRNRTGAVGRAKVWPAPRAWSIVLAALILRHGFPLRTAALVFAATLSASISAQSAQPLNNGFRRVRIFRDRPRRHLVREGLHRIHSKGFHRPRRLSRILFFVAGNG